MSKGINSLLIVIMTYFLIACAAHTQSGYGKASGTSKGKGTGTITTTGTPPTKPIGHELPNFSWPPPKPSAFSVINRNLLTLDSNSRKIGHLENILRKALDSAGYYDVSYYSVESQPDAFVMATRLEKINDNATSFEGQERWITNINEKVNFSLTDYFEALFYAKPGKYRIILFIISAHPIIFDQQSVNSEKAKSWILDGSSSLTTKIRNHPVSPDHNVTALIYEFEKNSVHSNSQDPKDVMLILPSTFQTRTHLERSGIWNGFINQQ